MKEKYTSPSYQWYPERFESSPDVQDMTTYEQEGIYRRLIDYEWKRGYVPDDVDRIAAILPKIRSKARVKALWESIRHCFVEESPGRLITPRLEEVRRYAEAKSAAGSAGGRVSGQSRRSKPEANGQANAKQTTKQTTKQTRSKPEAKANPPNSELRTPEEKENHPTGTTSPSGGKRKHRLPPGFEPSGTDRDWAASEGFTEALIASETEQFRDHWRGNGETKLDWGATWRNWMRNTRKFNRSKRNDADERWKRNLEVTGIADPFAADS